LKLQDHLPADHRLGTVYRYGAGLCGLALLVFGSLGFLNDLAFLSTRGERVVGLSSNGLLSLISVVVAVVLIAGAVVGGNAASTVNMAVGFLFLGSGFVNLALLDTKANFLAFHMQNVMFSFVVGLMLLTFGMYGRVSGGLPHDNPYWRARHPEQAAHEDHMRAAAGAAVPAGSIIVGVLSTGWVTTSTVTAGPIEMAPVGTTPLQEPDPESAGAAAELPHGFSGSVATP
jgi:hypothetical protein